MKYTSYILAAIGVLLVFNIFLSYSSPSYRNFLRQTKQNFIGVSRDEVIEKLTKDQLEVNTKLLNSIDKLNENFDHQKDRQVSSENVSSRFAPDKPLSKTGAESQKPVESQTGTTESGAVDNTPIEIPGTLLAKLMPEIVPVESRNTGFFGVIPGKTFEKAEYKTYADKKKRIEIYVFAHPYSEILAKFKKSNRFKINETDNYFGFSFFANPLKKDSVVRLITQFEGVAVGFELPQTQYQLLKKSLLE